MEATATATPGSANAQGAAIASVERYSVKYWSGIAWEWIEHAQVLAQNEEQVRALIDAECQPEHRLKHSLFSEGSSFYKPPYDSLTITHEGTLTLPCIID